MWWEISANRFMHHKNSTRIKYVIKITQDCVKSSTSVNTYNSIMLIGKNARLQSLEWRQTPPHTGSPNRSVPFSCSLHINYGHSLHVKPTGKLPNSGFEAAGNSSTASSLLMHMYVDSRDNRVECLPNCSFLPGPLHIVSYGGRISG